MEDKNKIILIITSIILIITISFFLFSNSLLTGRTIEDYNRTHTQAVCNKTLKGNIYCEDYEVICKGNQIITANIIAGHPVPHEKNWQDPRGENGSIITCE